MYIICLYFITVNIPIIVNHLKIIINLLYTNCFHKYYQCFDLVSLILHANKKITNVSHLNSLNN